ncbi:xanthine dehydrogenase family protein subunit M [Paenibacillus sp. N3.4]|uniref:FAD binding domain-containing protein n=1 Tax=Paenibacillus sp. N3.4 TaxID=2603222 RepID=UPI0011C89DE9|nr:FAD binding domain-containing protein [Paenibacillus sp. N3.4]TXK73763.1 hypothetical protein FU659_30480 [Paenibacillus sp. N3.4]
MSVSIYPLPEQQPSVWQPASVVEAMQMKQQWGDHAVLVAGGTWLRTRWENAMAPLPQHLISLGRIPTLTGLSVDPNGLIHIGPALCLADLINNELIRNRCKLLVQACSEIAAPSVRNLASIGGNVMTRTGDLLPALLVMDAQVRSSDGTVERVLPICEWLASPVSKDYELLTGLMVPSTELVEQEYGYRYKFYLKVGRREAFTPSVVTVAGQVSLDAESKIRTIALAAGGGNAVPARFEELEASIIGQRLSKKLLQTLHAGVAAGFKAVADDYAGIPYRKRTAANLIVSELYKAWRKGGAADALES